MIPDGTSIKAILLAAPDSQIDPAVLDIIRKWDDPETAANVLEALDCAAYCGGASGFAMGVLDILLQAAIKKENTTYEEVVKAATWRKL
jgi:hypothetical protein